jgi:hypothetical protein
MSVAVMEALQPARSASVGRRTSTIAASTGAAAPNTADEIIEDRRKHPDGTVQVRKYLKGRFLGKVIDWGILSVWLLRQLFGSILGLISLSSALFMKLIV